jgi:hypothetical protein
MTMGVPEPGATPMFCQGEKQIMVDRHRRLSVYSLPVLKPFEESRRSLISVAQSATAGPGSLRAV